MKEIDFEEISRIRYNLHEEIYNIVLEKENRVFREANSSEKNNVLSHKIRLKKQPASKSLIIVKDMEEAEQIKAIMEQKIDNANNIIGNKLKASEAKHYKINYKINIINAYGDLQISVKSAEKRKGNMPGQIVKSKLRSLIVPEEAEEDREELINRIDDNKIYTYAIGTGNSYRVNYYDTIEEHRKQASVGNVLIVVGEDIKIIDNQYRKSREDKKSWIGSVYAHIEGMINIYE